MVNNLNKRRRQVAWQCFKPLLNEKQLVLAISILEQAYQKESVSNLVAYVSKICSEFNIETSKSISLYSEFRHLMQQEVDSDFDPIIFLKLNHTENVSQHVDYKLFLNKHSTVAQNNGLSVHCVIFSHFVKQIFFAIPNKNALLQTLTDSKATDNSPLLQKLIQSLTYNSEDYQWTIAANEKELSTLVHVIYKVLCELIGPVQADEYFHKAIANTEQLAEAKQFSPSRFL